MGKAYPLLFIALLLLALPACSADIISDPENVSYMKMSVTQSGKIELVSSSSSASAEDLSIRLYIPQNDSRQESDIRRVIGPDSYEIQEDSYGNLQIALYWENPRIDTPIDYLVDTEVKINRKSSDVDRSFPVTKYVKANKEIIEAAYTLSPGKKSVENMFRIGTWVNDNIEYDLSCENEAFPADWVYREKRGTCDEFANLMLSMLKALGYESWYVAGYAYLGGKQEGWESFGSHAWVETRLNGVTYDIDPTWSESPVDATHIVFARLPDSNFTEHTGVRSRDVTISWTKEETRLIIESYKEEPSTKIELQAFPESVEGGKNVILQAVMKADGCVMTNLRTASCINDDGSSLIDIEKEKRPIYLCGERKFHWLGKTPGVQIGMKYTCPVLIAGGGARVKIPVTITSESSGDVSITATTGKILTPGQQFPVTASVRNNGFSQADLRLFALIGDEIEEGRLVLGHGETGSADFTLEAPTVPGKYDLNIFASSGDMATEIIEVVSQRNLSMTEIEYPPSLNEGESAIVNVTVVNSGEETNALIRFVTSSGETEEELVVEKDGSSGVSFNYTSQKAGNDDLTISLLGSSGNYQDSWTGTVEVIGKPSIKEDISSQLEQFILGIIEAIRSIFGL